MRNIITSPDKDPLGNMMLDYLNGESAAYVDVVSTTVDMWKMKGVTMFRKFAQMGRIEQKALGLCRGKILDVGAGSGCHSLYLQKRNQIVDALDISLGCIEVMKKRKVNTTIHGSLFSLQERSYDTLLMLMNGLGICGTIDGLNLFLQYIKTLLTTGGQVIADSTDLAVLYDVTCLASSTRGYFGETEFKMTYKGAQSDPFPWLYIDFETLGYYTNLHGLKCEQILAGEGGKYLVRIYTPNIADICTLYI
ncbi:MAG: class I SAM-dependent methyltransferase [Desulfobacteraceae bacterium]|nr:class I SAM-dependent methyltransferase [Desulfobacteraceae bacterium]